MQKTPVTADPGQFPEVYRPLLSGPVFDSSCSPEARVWYLSADGGYYLKSAPAGSLARENTLGRYFHGKGLAPEILDYRTGDRDWLLSRRAKGEDGTHKDHLEKPEWLCDSMAEILRRLHETSFEGCPVPDHTQLYLSRIRENRKAGVFDGSFAGNLSEAEAWSFVESRGHLLQSDTLLHGDFCLPNVLWDGFAFSSFIDLGNGGVGDRHVDLFWGAWTLNFNLHTDRYRQRFFDAYGRDRVDPERILLVGAAECFG